MDKIEEVKKIDYSRLDGYPPIEPIEPPKQAEGWEETTIESVRQFLLKVDYFPYGGVTSTRYAKDVLEYISGIINHSRDAEVEALQVERDNWAKRANEMSAKDITEINRLEKRVKELEDGLRKLSDLPSLI